MAYVYGDILCATAHDWVYGEILCVELPDEEDIKPTEPWVRVSSLTHIWTPGTYLLMIGLGDLTSEFVMPDIATKGPRTSVTPPDGTPPDGEPDVAPPTIPCPEGCTVGILACIGKHLYQCVPMPTTDPSVYPPYAWILQEANSSACR